MEASVPMFHVLSKRCSNSYVPPSAQAGGRGGELRLNWLPLGIKAETKGLSFVQVATDVPSLMPLLLCCHPQFDFM